MGHLPSLPSGPLEWRPCRCEGSDEFRHVGRECTLSAVTGRDTRRHRTSKTDTAIPRERLLTPRQFVAVLTLIVIAAAAVRVAAALGELWLDEIWSLNMSRLLTGPASVLTDLHHDNNHHLNTLLLRLLPEQAGFVLYRLHSLAAGVGTVVVSMAIARRAGQLAAIAAGVIAGASFVLILYSSEARGYSLAVFFAFLAVLIAERFMATDKPKWALAFALVTVAGLLSHLTFVHAYVGLLAWTGWRLRFRDTGRTWVKAAALLHLAPLLTLAVLYWIDVRHLQFGGAPVRSLGSVVASALSLSWSGLDVTVLALAAIALGIAALRELRRSGSDLWILFLVTMVSPAATLFLVETDQLFERYFVVSLSFLMLSLSWLVARVGRRSVTAAVVLLAGYVLANSVNTLALLRYGRGSYQPVLATIVARTVRPVITVSSDDDYRHGVMLNFYRSRVRGAEQMQYQSGAVLLPPGPEWVLKQSQKPGFEPAPTIRPGEGYEYRLIEFHRSAILSGWHLALYHNVQDGR